jgi:hypothetical protein
MKHISALQLVSMMYLDLADSYAYFMMRLFTYNNFPDTKYIYILYFEENVLGIENLRGIGMVVLRWVMYNSPDTLCRFLLSPSFR